ncbi:MAG: hypothetical protein ACJAXK_003291 [Yoonia sp.]|jgi:hypothetical protein
MKKLWKNHKLALGAFVLAVVVLGYFAVQTTISMIYWMDPAHQDQPLASWMTPRYVAQSYKLPPDMLGPALFLVKGETPKRQSLGTIAANNNMTMNELQVRIDTATAAWRAEQDAKK